MNRCGYSGDSTVVFLDGPAVSAKLHLGRTPEYLRVVVDGETGKIDALDQLHDEPRETETVHVYRKLGVVHVDYRDGKRRGEWLTSYGTTDEIDGGDVRDNADWRAAVEAATEIRDAEVAP